MKRWKDAAKYCRREYGVQVDEGEGFFICVECGEPIYFDDWTSEETADWSICPICEINLYEDVE